MSRSAAAVWEAQGVGERLRLLRTRQRMTQVALAQRLTAAGIGVHKSMIARFELWDADPPHPDARRPSLFHLLVICGILEVSLSDLGVTEEEYPEVRVLRDPKLMEHIRCSVRRRRDLGGRQPPLLVVARSET